MKRRDLRAAVFERDLGVCAACGFDAYWWHLTAAVDLLCFPGRLEPQIAVAMAHDAGLDPRTDTWWQADHIVPLALGGADDLANLQTLCTICHARKTARDAADIARKARRAARGSGQGPRGGRRRSIPSRVNPWPPKGARPMRGGR